MPMQWSTPTPPSFADTAKVQVVLTKQRGYYDFYSMNFEIDWSWEGDAPTEAQVLQALEMLTAPFRAEGWIVRVTQAGEAGGRALEDAP